ncbi:hypothetical protein ACI6QG_13840 [Roseococcus sp. DSY-14]|uniref:hypothetical protein n=1 Tax=Roseococcus sp. DSY-14 TaxID=3369650 RepID=UPI00387B7B9E
MDLKDFVKATLLELVAAVGEARAATTDDTTGTLIAPLLAGAPLDVALPVRKEDGGGHAHVVSFDLSVTVSAESTSRNDFGGKLSIKVVELSGGVGGSEREGRTNVQRIKFVVPVRYPHGLPPPTPPAVTDREREEDERI